MKQLMKCMFLLLLVGGQVTAQNLKVWMSNPTMVADGETVTYLTIYQTDIIAAGEYGYYWDFQMVINVPEGISIAQKRSGRAPNYTYTNDITLNSDRYYELSVAVSAAMPDATSIKIGTQNTVGAYYQDDENGNVVEELFTIGLVADPSMKNGTYTIDLSDVIFAKQNDHVGTRPAEPATATLTVTGGQAAEGEIQYTLPEAGMGTLILPYAAALPEGVSAYRCTGVEGTSVVLEGQSEITANTPLLLAGTPGTYTFTGTSEAAENSYTSGVMTGVLQAEEITSGYVLQQQEGVTGFYRVGSSITVPANRCYLNVDSNVKMLSLKFIEDGVETVKKALEDDEAFDLGGRRVTRTQKGVYIRNGKKVIIK